MMASNPAGAGKWWERPIHTAYELYVFIIVLAVFGFCLGVEAVLLSNDLGRANPYHVHSEVFSVVVDVFLMVAIGIHVRRLVRRLLRDAQPQ